MGKKKIVITGAAGNVVGRVLPQLREQYDLVLLDIHSTNARGNAVQGVHLADLTDPDRETYRAFFKGADLVLHTAYTFSERAQGHQVEQAWDAAFGAAGKDVQMAYNVYRVAQEEGVPRVVVFSSNQAANFYEQLIRQGYLETMHESMVPYAANFYGWSKIGIESLGHLFATRDAPEGKALEVVCVRLGAPRTDLIESLTSKDYYAIRRNFGNYLSEKDELQLLRLCIETEDIRDGYGVPFLLVYGVSNNYNRLWSLDNARKVLGYKPESNSYLEFPERIKELFGAHIDEQIRQGNQHE